MTLLYWRRFVQGCAWFVISVCLPVAWAFEGDDREAATTVDVLLLAPRDIELRRIDARIDGAAPGERFARDCRALFDYFDRDASGDLSADEASRLPAPFSLRQLAQGELHAGAIGPAAAGRIDRDGNELVEPPELVAFYRAAGLGRLLVTVAELRATAELNKALFKAMHVKDDQPPQPSEAAALAATLKPFDANRDELIEPGELVPGLEYPGVQVTTPLLPIARDASDAVSMSPVWLLPADRADHGWARLLFRRFDADADGRLALAECGWSPRRFASLDRNNDSAIDLDELLAWRDRDVAKQLISLTPTGELTLEPGTLQPTATGGVEADGGNSGGLELDLRTTPARTASGVAAASDRYEYQFAVADADGDGALAEEELTKAAESIKLLSRIADRDADSRLTADELRDWAALHRRLSQGFVVTTILSAGPGLFERLDQDHDGRLSTRELRGAGTRMTQPIDGAPRSLVGLPSQFIALASPGHPAALLPRGGVWPVAWQAALDTNRDGDISAVEFVGPRDTFDAVDQDHDGLISPAEAAAWR